MERPDNQPPREMTNDYFMNLERLARERIEQELQALAQEGILSESGKYIHIWEIVICLAFPPKCWLGQSCSWILCKF